MIAYMLVSGLAVTLALFVYSRNVREPMYRYYLLFTLSVVLWLSGSVVAKSPDFLFEFHFRMLIVFAVMLSFYLLMFITEFTGRKLPMLPRLFIISAGVLVSYLSLFTDLLTRRVYLDAAGSLVAEQGMYYAFAAAWVSLIGSLGIPIIAYELHRSRADKQRRRQLAVVLLSLIFSAAAAVMTGYVLPYITSDLGYYTYSPFSSLIFSFGFAYAILRLKLFNVKAVAARGVAYILAVLVLVVSYSVLVNVIGPLLAGKEISLSGSGFVSSIATTAILVLFYPSTKRLFDKVTNQLFFRDEYDPQVFLDQLNKLLVASIDLEVMLKQCAGLIADSMKVRQVGFYLRDTAYYDSRLIGNSSKMVTEKEARDLERLLPKTGKKLIYVDELERTDSHSEAFVKDILRRNNIEVLVRIVSTLEYEIAGVGYVLLGQKMSGNMYDQQDLRLLEIVGNELEIALENALRYEEIQQFNITLQKKIDEATNELKRSNVRLRELDEAKDEFVSMASHQLRTPLTAVKGYISMLSEGDAGATTAEQKKMLDAAMLSSQRMVHLIADLLNVSRMKTKKFVITHKETYLPDVVSSEIGQLKGGAKSKHIKFEFDKPKRFPILSLDEVKLRQVIMNFMDNAIYYTPEGGKVEVELKNKKDSVEFTVKDTGIGVPAAEKHKLFTKFYRAENARRARPDGTGLGLFMAKKVVTAQGGEIIFESTEGKGSTFGFKLSKSVIKVVKK